MSLTDLEIQKHTKPILAELDRQKEKCAAMKAERDDREAELTKERAARGDDIRAANAEITALNAGFDASMAGVIGRTDMLGAQAEHREHSLRAELVAESNLVAALQSELAAEKLAHIATYRTLDASRMLLEAETRRSPTATEWELVSSARKNAERERDRLRDALAKEIKATEEWIPHVPEFWKPALRLRVEMARAALDTQLLWLINYAREAVSNPDKARFAESNQALLDACLAEVGKRGIVDDMPPPHVDADAPPDIEQPF